MSRVNVVCYFLCSLGSIFLQANSWSSVSTLQTENNQNYPGQTVAAVVNDSGMAVATWRDFIDSSNIYVTASIFNGTVWSDPVHINTSSAQDNRIAAAINNAAIAAITWSDTPHDQISISIYKNNTWSSPSAVSTSGSVTAAIPKIAIDANGNIIVVWIKGSGSSQSVLTRRLNSDGVFLDSGETTLSGALTTITGTPDYNTYQLSMNSVGQAMTIWGAGSTGSMQLRYAYFDGNSWTGIDQPITTTPGTYLTQTISLNSSGLAAATWSDRTTFAPNKVVAVSLFDRTSWSAPTFLQTSTVSVNPGIDRTQISRDNFGNAVASWIKQTVDVPATFTVESAYYNAGTGVWSAPAVLANPGYGSQLAGNPSGQALISWSAGVANNSTISAATGILQASLYQSGIWGSAVTLSSLSGVAVANQIALANSGIGLAAWRLGQATPNNVVVQTSLFSANLSGSKTVTQFLTQRDNVNVVSWAPIWSPHTFLYYVLTRNGVTIAQIPGNAQPVYNDHNCDPSASYNYTITGYTATGATTTYTVTL